MKRKLKATPRFIMLLTLICLIFAGAVILSQQAKLNEIAAKQEKELSLGWTSGWATLFFYR